MATKQEDLFLTVLESYKDRLYRVCKSYAKGSDEAQDLFQEVVLNIWKSLPGYKGQAGLSTWMYRITLNVCLQARYRQDKKQARTLRLESIHMEKTPSEEFDAEEEERYKALHQCIQQLNDSDKSVIVLFLEDLPYKDIAEITGLTENHVAVKIKRIKSKLFTCITTELC
ncbi:RNA polymerase sigma factor [Pontibacter roseus]|uniref:RNA polymerase sigma factor n=1 Tax=Pontibacter roseus TaxID=336989 RepID=UPI00036F3A74|nr:sigma-70 family RNA polymerase sigma factor [Pontibacter roseus]